MSEAVEVYLRLKALFGGVVSPARRVAARTPRSRDAADAVPFGPGRDPRGLGAVIDSLSSELGWTSPLAQSDLLLSWPELVGTETAAHSTPAGITEGVLTVRCDSTGWATQLRLMRTQILEHIASGHPDAAIDSIRFQGPDVPSWKKGPRSIPGRGPRDTYG
jgi:Zn-ribbon-containing, possibly RNA-binding protein and truncated derivatives